MNDQQLVEALSSVSQRYRRVIIGSATAGALGVAALGGIAVRQWLHGSDYQLPMFAAGYAALLGGALSPILVHWLRKTRDPVWLAHKLEKRFPELDTRLLAAVEQPDKNKEGMGFLQQMVISQAVSHSRRNGWDQVVPEGRIKGAKLAQWSMVAACAVVGCTILWEAGRIVVAKVNAPREKITAKAEVPFEIKVSVEKEIERGAPLLVTATFGIERLPSDVQLLFREKDAETKQQGMSKSALNDPRFATRLPAVANDLEIAVKYNSKQTDWIAVKVFEFPQLKQADAHLKYPDFVGQPQEKDIPNTRIVTAVEGTNATLTFKLNKPVAEATLVPAPRQQQRGGAGGAGGRAGAGAPGAAPDAAGGPAAGRGGAIAGGPDAGARGGANGRGGAAGGRGRVTALAAQNGRGGANDILPDGVGSPTLKLEQSKTDPTIYTVKMDLVNSQLYQLQLVDADKRNNRDKASMTINVTADRPATVRVTSPSRDVEVSPLEELTVKGQVSDDFGVKRVGVTFTMRGEQQEVIIAENVPAKERRDFSKVIALEELKAQPDELLSYNLWAEDIGPDGKVRRTQSDMFFAEVRPFEEIYRQAQQPADGQQQQQRQQQQGNQQQQQAAQRAEDITNQLKQILAAMWTVSRREVNEKVTSEYVPDIQAILETQNAVMEAATGLEERITDQRAQNFLDSGMKNLQKAADLLKQAEGANTPDGPSAKPLPDAIAADQAAYNDFLKLRDRQFEVVRGRQGQQGNTAQARRQQQLNQMDLQDQQNRYQTQRQAQAEQEEQQRAQQQAEQQENRQVLNRLRDLAQRQQDLNQQIRETQSALQEAQTQQQREEAQRQLARLQEQQQQQLQETDELRNRLEEPQNQESMADARQQLDQARENVQQAAQSLSQGQADQAAAAGQRAAEQLNNLQDQVRRNAANQFADAMQGMRNDARALEQGAQDNAQQLAELDQAQRDPQPNQGGGLRNNQQQEAQATRQQLAGNLEQQRNQLNRLMENMQQTVQEAETSEPILARQLYDTIRQSQQRPPERALDNTQQLVRQGFTQQARQTNDEAVQGISRIREGVEQAASGVLGDETESLRRAREELDALSAQLEREIGRNIQEQQAQNAARGGRGQNPQNPQQAQNGRNGRGQAAGQNPDGQNPNERQLADSGRGGRDGQQPGAAGQQPGAGRGQDPGQRGGRGQGQEPGQGPGQGDDRQLARGGRGQGQGENGDPNADPQGQGRGQGQRGGRGQGQGDPNGDPQVAGGQPGDPQGQQPGAGRGQGQRGGRGQGQGAGENPDPNGDPQVAGGQPGDPQGQPGAGRGQGQRGGRGQGQGQGENPDPNGDPQLAGGQPGDPQGQPGAGRGQGQRGGRGQGQGQGQGENPDPNGDPQLAGQPGGGRGQGQRGGQPGRGGAGGQGDPNQEGQPGDPNQEAQPGDPQLAGGQPGDPQGQRGGRGQGQRGGPGLRGGAGGGGQQDPNDPNQQNPQLARGGGGGGNPNINPQIAGGGDGRSTNDPLTGGGYRNFSDRLRDVQDMVSDPQLQRQAQQVRERTSAVRLDYQTKSTPPNWNTVSETIGKPLAELRDKVNQELLKRDKAQAALVPLDREPVPPEFQEQVKQYYEKLGSGK